MMTLEFPVADHRTLYELAGERFTDAGYKKRLADGLDRVMELGLEYIANAKTSSLSELSKGGAVPPSLFDGDMQKLYTQGLLRKKSDARKWYEKLRLSSPYRICPFCLHRNVKTLDHYLPKADYGAYAVLPANLIPSCRDCNSEKDEFSTIDRSTSLIHPYFDNVDNYSWLGCEITKHDGICDTTFFIQSSAVPTELLPRLISHMDVLDLFSLYDVEGAREINDMAGTLVDINFEHGAVGVKAICESMGRSRSKTARNYWRAALWQAAADDADFCSLSWLKA